MWRMLRLIDYEVFEYVTCKPRPFYAMKFLVASDAKLNYEVFECVHVQPYPFYVIKFYYLNKDEF